MAKSKQLKAPAHPDALLITSCIDYARELRGASGAFDVDPTGDSDFARAIDGAALKQADKASKAAANYSPSTFDGLRAKAAAAQIGLDLDLSSVSKLLRSLCEDVERFHKAMSAADTDSTNTEIAP